MVDEGIYTALWTPTDDRGHLLYDALAQIVHFLKQHKVHGFVAGGSTGEFFRLPLEERKKVTEAVMAEADGLPVFVNVASPVPHDVIALVNHARELKAAAIMALPPMYYPLSQEDIVAYFLNLADLAGGMPLILYNYPECARNSIERRSVEALIDRGAAAGIKQSGANIAFIEELAAAGKGRDFIVYSGNDTKLPEAMRLGAKGCIGGVGNAIPEISSEVFRRIKDGEDVADLQEKLDALAAIIKEESFPYTVQLLMEARGLPVGAPKLARASQSVEKHSRLVAQARALFQLWGFVR